jgi:hypothetical protein
LIFPLAHELAADDMDGAVACWVLGVSMSGYYDWLSRRRRRVIRTTSCC